MKYIFLFLAILILINSNAQSKKDVNPKIFCKENFKSDKLPEGWYITKVGSWDP